VGVDMAYKKLKEVLKTAPVLIYYDVNVEDVLLGVDASSESLQCEQPVVYASTAMAETQQKYPQIVKEALAIKFDCTRFHQQVYGKSLEIIFNKTIDKAPPRLQRLIMDVSLYAPKVVYVKSSEIPTTDALSRDVEKILRLKITKKN
jgi:hypothetical protein